MPGQPGLFTSLPAWEAMLADHNGPAAGTSLASDARAPFAWRQNREEGRKMEPETRIASDKKLSLAFNTHGGGSTLTEEIFLLRAIMTSFDFVIVSPKFRLVPEHPFPTPLDDGWDTLLWMLSNEGSLGFDRQNVLLAAGSARGSLISVLGVIVGNAIAGEDFGSEDVRPIGFGTQTMVKGIFLNVPITCHPSFLPMHESPNTSYAQAISGTTLLCSEEMYKIWELYAARSEPYDQRHPDMSPLLADLTNFPPPRIYTAGQDPVRDEALAFEHKLKDAAREVKVFMCLGHSMI
ncbi:MAG: hypothetical protein M1818_008381 [Claussenomyces sp. TS43310]|nr:MAG: hypothetical protein M1818_008381 [Claussenomyces sp. TS43310]